MTKKLKNYLPICIILGLSVLNPSAAQANDPLLKQLVSLSTHILKVKVTTVTGGAFDEVNAEECSAKVIIQKEYKNVNLPEEEISIHFQRYNNGKDIIDPFMLEEGKEYIIFLTEHYELVHPWLGALIYKYPLSKTIEQLIMYE